MSNYLTIRCKSLDQVQNVVDTATAMFSGCKTTITYRGVTAVVIDRCPDNPGMLLVQDHMNNTATYLPELTDGYWDSIEN